MNKILLIYSDISEKSSVTLLEDALKTVLRKFRKSVSFSSLHLDLAPSCRSSMKEILAQRVADSDGILWFGKKEQLTQEEAFAQECFEAHAKQYFFGGKCICTPFSLHKTDLNNDAVSVSIETPLSNIKCAVKIAIDAAKKRSRKILLCTDTESPYDTMLCKKTENSLSDTRSLNIDYYDFDELTYILSREVPPCDSILCSGDKAHLIAVSMNALNKFPVGYTVWHCEKTRIFKREFLPYEEHTNLLYSSMLIAAGNMLVKELGFTSAGAHLKKAVALTLEKCFSEETATFHKQLLFEINMPIRNRQVNRNDSDN